MAAFRILAFLLCVGALRPVAAHARVPISLDAMGGPAMGVGRWRDATAAAPFAAIAAVDLSYALGPGRAIVLCGEFGGVAGVGMRMPDSPPKVEQVVHRAVSLAIEGADADGSHVARLGVGVAMLDAEVTFHDRTATGLLITARLARRWIPDPGPLGFLGAIHTSHVFASGGGSHLVALTFGLTIHDRSRW